MKTHTTMGDEVVIVTPAPDTASREEAKANARLIAAAPELFAALLDLVGMVELGLDTADLCVAARAAIAKARGES